jgi:hypothetical protein
MKLNLSHKPKKKKKKKKKILIFNFFNGEKIKQEKGILEGKMSS